MSEWMVFATSHSAWGTVAILALGAVVLGAIVWACMHTVFVEPREAAFLRRKSRRVYYRGPAYWRYHRLGLKELNETINWPCNVANRPDLTLVWLILNAGMSVIAALHSWNRSRITRRQPC
jgi:hypothetical protein